MRPQITANTQTAGSLMANSMFEVPQFQREYSWGKEEVLDFFTDLQGSVSEDTYFLGLIVLIDSELEMQVIDGQQRLLTLSLLAIALQKKALLNKREALARSIDSMFLRSIDYPTDETRPRLILANEADSNTYNQLLGEHNEYSEKNSPLIRQAYSQIESLLTADLLAHDPFKRLGDWTDFLAKRLQFAVFIHPDAQSAYRVFEVVNTRGKDLTTADLLKNFLLRELDNTADVYTRWQRLAESFSQSGQATLVQYIRHVVTMDCGHVLPKDLYAFLASKLQSHGRTGMHRPPPSPDRLLDELEAQADPYMQMSDPTLFATSSDGYDPIYRALADVGVISVRPILLALRGLPDDVTGMQHVLKLVIKRIAVGNLGTGNVERLLSEAAYNIRKSGAWSGALGALDDLVPAREDFFEAVRKRQFTARVLWFLLRSIDQQSITPSHQLGHSLWSADRLSNGSTTKLAAEFDRTLGNSWIGPHGWQFDQLPLEIDPVPASSIARTPPAGYPDEITSEAIVRRGDDLALRLTAIWYTE